MNQEDKWLGVILTLSEQPSFSCDISWDILNGRDNQHVLVREIKSIQPYHELIKKDWWEEIKPLIYREVILSNSEIDPWLNQLQSIHIPVMITKSPIGYDGVTYSLKFKDSSSSSQLTWWADGPKEWHQITEWYHNFKSWLQSELEVENP